MESIPLSQAERDKQTCDIIRRLFDSDEEMNSGDVIQWLYFAVNEDPDHPDATPETDAIWLGLITPEEVDDSEQQDVRLAAGARPGSQGHTTPGSRAGG